MHQTGKAPDWSKYQGWRFACLPKKFLKNLFFFKCKQSLPQVVKSGEEAHANEHGDIFLDLSVYTGEQPEREWLCDAIGEQIAYCDIDGESYDLFSCLAFASEGEIFIEEEAQDAGQCVVGD